MFPHHDIFERISGRWAHTATCNHVALTGIEQYLHRHPWDIPLWVKKINKSELLNYTLIKLFLAFFSPSYLVWDWVSGFLLPPFPHLLATLPNMQLRRWLPAGLQSKMSELGLWRASRQTVRYTSVSSVSCFVLTALSCSHSDDWTHTQTASEVQGLDSWKTDGQARTGFPILVSIASFTNWSITGIAFTP